MPFSAHLAFIKLFTYVSCFPDSSHLKLVGERVFVYSRMLWTVKVIGFWQKDFVTCYASRVYSISATRIENVKLPVSLSIGVSKLLNLICVNRQRHVKSPSYPSMASLRSWRRYLLRRNIKSKNNATACWIKIFLRSTEFVFFPLISNRFSC